MYSLSFWTQASARCINVKAVWQLKDKRLTSWWPIWVEPNPVIKQVLCKEIINYQYSSRWDTAVDRSVTPHIRDLLLKFLSKIFISYSSPWDKEGVAYAGTVKLAYSTRFPKTVKNLLLWTQSDQIKVTTSCVTARSGSSDCFPGDRATQLEGFMQSTLPLLFISVAFF